MTKVINYSPSSLRPALILVASVVYWGVNPATVFIDTGAAVTPAININPIQGLMGGIVDPGRVNIKFAHIRKFWKNSKWHGPGLS